MMRHCSIRRQYDDKLQKAVLSKSIWRAGAANFRINQAARKVEQKLKDVSLTLKRLEIQKIKSL
jgi:hypothetical protein